MVVQHGNATIGPVRYSEWREVTLAELVHIKHGFAFKGISIHDEPVGDVLLTPRNFAIGGGFKGERFKYYDGSIPEDFVLSEGDLLVTMTDLSKRSDTLGYPALVPASTDGRRYLHNQRLGKILPKGDGEICVRYIYYVMCGAEYRHEVLASATGTTVKHTSPHRIRQYRFNLPPLSEQWVIANILSTLDKKIELNRRMNETLEAMARALFKSWFVDFDPVRAKMEGCDTGLPHYLADLFPNRLVDSELGEIPEGWTVTPLKELIEVNPTRSLPRGQFAPYLPMRDMPTRGHAPDSVSVRRFGSGMRFANGDTLIARITPCLENGKTAYVDFLRDDEVGWGSTEYIVLKPRLPLPDQFAYCLARSVGFREFAIQSMSGTSGRQRVPVAALNEFLMVTPPVRLASQFGEAAELLFERANRVGRESCALAALRDTLLPKLISGEIRVGDAERALESVS